MRVSVLKLENCFAAEIHNISFRSAIVFNRIVVVENMPSLKMHNRAPTVEECDATKLDSSNTDDNIIAFL
jgi:hypothetical protein